MFTKQTLQRIAAWLVSTLLLFVAPAGLFAAADPFSALSSRISTVFNYKSGMLASVKDANGNLQIFDRGKYRGTVDADGTWLNIMVNHNDDVAASGGLEKYLNKWGISDSQLQGSLGVKMSDSGKASIEKEATKAAWINTAIVHISKANNSISVNFSQGGAGVTLVENGKNVKTYAHDGAVVEEYNYGRDGLLEYTDTKQLKMITKEQYDKLSSENKSGWNKDDSGADVYYQDQKARVIYYSQGQLIGKAKSSVLLDSSGKVVGDDTSFNYRNDGSLQSTYDYATKETSHYQAGKLGFVTNDLGIKVSARNYHLNGTINAMEVFAAEGGWSTTVFDTRGRAVVSGSGKLGTGTNDLNADTMRKEYTKIINNPSYTKPAWLQSIQLYANQIKDMNNETLKLVMGWNTGDEDVKYFKSFALQRSIGNGPVLTLTYADTQNGSVSNQLGITGSGNKFVVDVMLYAYGAQAGKVNCASLDPSAQLEGEIANKLVEKAFDVSAINAELENKVSETSSAEEWIAALDELSSKIDTLSLAKLENLFINKESADISITYEQGSAATVASDDKAAAALSSVRTELKARVSSLRTILSKYVGTGNTLPSDINDQLSAVGTKISIVQGYNCVSADPIVIGTFSGLEQIDGRTYAKLSVDTIDILDGKGMQDMDGVMFVDVTDAPEIAASLATTGIGESVMFMGDISSDVSGSKSIKVNVSYGGGFISGEKAVADAKEGLQDMEFYKKNFSEMSDLIKNDILNQMSIDQWNALEANERYEIIQQTLGL
ncbi:MAG: hypothetical protein A2219_01015 [Elusimicrobia bacterium RIFOXYA2_FULL_50_26]|nr:MAG: hypothetical protein A2219_01015 [Elusimicrobia bacterium RIFOXYA2_FULL_50_26]OGS22710.1 MAG: hypothetical protein A2314_08595 [Elusimicrobia bacterium RIFOXYB2_FULL_50_12]